MAALSRSRACSSALRITQTEIRGGNKPTRKTSNVLNTALTQSRSGILILRYAEIFGGKARQKRSYAKISLEKYIRCSVCFPNLQVTLRIYIST